MAAKRHKKHKNKISGFVISMSYETEIREFWLFTRLSNFKLQKNLKLVLEIFYIQRLNYNLGILFEFFM
jgi:hypothetical protein